MRRLGSKRVANPQPPQSGNQGPYSIVFIQHQQAGRCPKYWTSGHGDDQQARRTERLRVIEFQSCGKLKTGQKLTLTNTQRTDTRKSFFHNVLLHARDMQGSRT
jgi:hypothetical protein